MKKTNICGKKMWKGWDLQMRVAAIGWKIGTERVRVN